MGLFNHFPYTNFHELNLDWIIDKIKVFGAKVEEFQRIIDNIPTGDRIDALRAEVARVEGKADANTEAIAELPDEYPNPESVTFTGAVNTSYNGSAPVTVDIPEMNVSTLTFTGAVNATYDGSEPVTVNIPEGGGAGGGATLTFTGAVEATYDGSEPVTVNIPESGGAGGGATLTFTGAVEATYDGSTPITVDIPAGKTIKRFTAKSFGYATEVAAGTYNFDEAPEDYSPSKCFLVQVVFHATSNRTSSMGCSYWTPSGRGDSIDNNMFAWTDGSSISFYQRTFQLDIGAGSIYFGTGHTSTASGTLTTGDTYCLPFRVIVYYLA